MSYPTAISYGLIALTTVILGYYTLNDDTVNTNEEPSVPNEEPEEPEKTEESSGGLFGGITEEEKEENKEEENKEETEESGKSLFDNLPFATETSEKKVGGKNMKTRRHKKKNKKTAKRRD